MKDTTPDIPDQDDLPVISITHAT